MSRTPKNKFIAEDTEFMDVTPARDEEPRPYSMFVVRNETTKKISAYDIYLYASLDCPYEYAELLNLIKRVDKSIRLNFHINSVGGEYNTLAAFLHVLSQNKSEKTLSIDGEASSAAAILACFFNKIYVFPYSSIFFHNIQMSLGSSSDATKIVKEMNNMKRVYYELLKKYCSDILTNEEIDGICLEEKDLFLTGTEFRKRLKPLGRLL